MADDRSKFLERLAQLSPTKLALLALDLREKLEAATAPKRAPVAIIGMGCRAPGGVTSPDALWELLKNGKDAIEEVPSDRWDVDRFYDSDPNAPGKMASKWGGFVGDLTAFDPQFFGIAPREAASLDPQQRLLLEVAWEALESAGRAPDSLQGTRAGVFVGIAGSDYLQMLLRADPRELDVYLATGMAHSVASGRLSYLFGLTGPAVSVDTACSSSLVSVHLACQSLLTGECDLAIAAGVNAILVPEITVAMSRSGMMAADGRCKAFDARADGFVRSEGCGVIILKRLDDAVRDGDRVISVILGSATNQDGRSNGLTAPNGPSQRAVIRAALDSARVAATDVGVVEAHGTGTSLGDPIEVAALGAELGADRDPARPLLVVGAKANLGHLESAAGVIGLIKAALMVRNGQVPPQIHFEKPNPFIDWENLPVAIPTALTPWPHGYARRIAGVSSFGLSGTNAHIVLAEPPVAAAPHTDTRPQVVCLSADDAETLKTFAARFADRLTVGDASLTDVAYTAAVGRARRAHRVAVTGDDAEGVARLLRELDTDDPRLVRGVIDAGSQPKIAFLFTGQGAQYATMGRRTYEEHRVFRDAIDRCDAIASPKIGRSLTELLFSDEHGRDLEHPPWGQPALFAFEYALACLWRSWGVEPDVMMGHSLGEFVASCLAGVLSLEDGLALVHERGRLSARLPETGAMIAIGVAADAIEPVIAPVADRVSIAAVNGPQNTVISGETAIVQAIARDFAARGHRTHALPISRAFHSVHVDPILDDFERFASGLTFGSATHQIISNVTGDVAGDELGTPGYWRRHLREAVQFSRAMQTLRTLDCTIFLEVGPHPVLSVLGQHCTPDGGGTWVTTMHRERDERAVQLEVLSKLYTAGVAIDWDAWYATSGARRVSAPTYPFRRTRHWIRGEPRAETQQHLRGVDGHVFPGAKLDLASRATVFDAALSTTELSFLRDHRVHDALVVPAPMMFELGRAASISAIEHASANAIDEFVVLQPLVLTEGSATRLQTLVTPLADGLGATFEISSIGNGEATLHATGRLTSIAPIDQPRESIDEVRSRLGEPVDGPAYYESLRAKGVDFGPRFRGIQRLWRSSTEALAVVEQPNGVPAVAHGTPLHPVLLDSLLQTLGSALTADASRLVSDMYLMVGFDRCTLPRSEIGGGWCHATLRSTASADARELVGDIQLVDDTGNVALRIEGIRLRRATRTALLGTRTEASRSLYEIEWISCDGQLAATGLAPSAIADAAGSAAPQLAIQHGLDSYDALVGELEALSILYVARAFDELGLSLRVGARVSRDDLRRRGMLAKFDRLGARLFEMLIETGAIAEAADGAYLVIAPPKTGDLDDLLRDLVRRFPAFQGEIDLLDACGRALAGVIRGERDPLQILFPAGSMARVEKLTQSSPAAQAINTLAARAVRAATATPSKRLRVLEIGAGTGGTTGSVLEALAGSPFEYCFTDVSPLFLARASEKFGTSAQIEYERLDIEDPAASRLHGRQFDIVIGANVIHATSDLRASLENIRSFLAPGGTLVLVEGVMKQRWVDLTFGLTDGWWMFRDDRRASHPLLTREGWAALLREAGLEFALIPSSSDATGALARQAVIIARTNEAKVDPRRYVVVGDNASARDELVALLSARGSEAAAIEVDEIRRTLDAAPTDIVYLAPSSPAAATTADEYSAAVERATRPLLDLIQRMVAEGAGSPAKLWVVTRGAQPGCLGSPDDEPTGAPVWGLGRTMATEHPEFFGALVDVDARDPRAAAAAVVTAMSVRDENELCVRDGRLFAARLRRCRLPATSSMPEFSRDGTYLVTGGLRGVGLQVAQWLADNGAGHLVLVARRAIDDGAAEAVARMRAAGAEVTIRNLDIGDETAVTALLGEIRAMRAPLRGVMHVAGIFDDRTLIRHDWQRFERVLWPKVRGAWLLDRLTADLALDFFVLFASGASFLAPVGLANYAAANAFIDALAHHRRLSGRPAVSIDWGPWAKLGMADAVGDQREQQWTSGGFSQMAKAEALALLGRIMLGSPAQVGAFNVEWDRYLGSLGRRVPMFANFANEARTVGGGTAPVTKAEPELSQKLKDVSIERRWELLLTVVDREVRHVLGFNESDLLDPHRGLFDLGLDSLTAVELKNRLQRVLGQTIPATVVFDHSSVTALARYVAKRVDVPVAPAAAAPVASPAADQTAALSSLSMDELAAKLSAKLRGTR